MVLPLTYDNSNQRSVSRVNIMQQQLVLLLLNFISAMPRKAYFSRLRLCNYAYKFGRFFKQCSLLIDSFLLQNLKLENLVAQYEEELNLRKVSIITWRLRYTYWSILFLECVLITKVCTSSDMCVQAVDMDVNGMQLEITRLRSQLDDMAYMKSQIEVR